MSFIHSVCYRYCLTCQHKQPYPVHSPLCSFCEKKLPLSSDAACLQCAYPMITSTQTHCGKCITKPPHYNATIAGFTYQYPITYLIHQFKFANRWRLADTLGKWLHNILTEQHHKLAHPPDCMLPVPLHRKRLRERGYNQSLLLAKAMQKAGTSLPLIQPCEKLTHSASQTSLNKQARESAPHHFSMTHELPHSYQHPLLIDDVMTTGATANALARCLKQAGAESVSVCCLARTCQSQN